MSDSLNLHSSAQVNCDDDDDVEAYDSIEHGIVPLEEMKELDEQVGGNTIGCLLFQQCLPQKCEVCVCVYHRCDRYFRRELS